MNDKGFTITGGVNVPIRCDGKWYVVNAIIDSKTTQYRRATLFERFKLWFTCEHFKLKL